MAAPILLLFLFIPSAYSNKCPGGYDPRPTPCNDKIAHLYQNKFCCPLMVSKMFKDNGIDWPVVGIVPSTKNKCTTLSSSCGKGNLCDDSKPLDPIWGYNEIQQCYKLPECNGETSTSRKILCKSNNQCDTGWSCDTDLTRLNPNIKMNGFGICCKPGSQCPLSDQSVSQNSQCPKGNECAAPKQCFPVESGKYCCPIDEKYYCMDGSLPTKVKNKLNHPQGKEFKCDKKIEYDAKTSDKQEEMCCPRIISHDYKGVGIEKEPVNPGQKCDNNGNCNPNEFCGLSTLLNSATPLTIGHCYPKPSCIGTSVTLNPKGLKFCPDNKCGANEFCDISALGLINKGICCSFECGAGPVEAKSEVKGTAGGICTGCEQESKELSYCGSGLINNENQIDVCKKVKDGKYRQCTYQRITASCPSGYSSQLRTGISQDLVTCANDVECQTQGVSASSRCVGTGHPSGKKICCRGDFCPDMWLLRKEETACIEDYDCKNDGNDGSCEKTLLNPVQDSSTHCCPRVEHTNQQIQVHGPYRSNKKCTKLAECLGENRFCDPYKGTCMYHRKVLDRDELQTGITCTTDSMQCGNSKQIVCMAEGQSKQPKCYRHPLDECNKNGQCTGGYCALKSAAAGVDSFRQCYPAPTDANVDSTKVGLELCDQDSDCGSGNECHLDSSVPGVKKGFCRTKIPRQCGGLPKLTYIKGQLQTCSTKAHCKDDEFCDLEVTPAVGLTGRGLCCMKQGLCPIDKTSGQLELTPDFKAIQCSSASKCPKGSACYNGVCCKTTDETKLTVTDLYSSTMAGGLTSGKGMPLWAWMSIGVGVLLLTVAIGVGVLWWCKKRKRAKKSVKATHQNKKTTKKMDKKRTRKKHRQMTKVKDEDPNRGLPPPPPNLRQPDDPPLNPADFKIRKKLVIDARPPVGPLRHPSEIPDGEVRSLKEVTYAPEENVLWDMGTDIEEYNDTNEIVYVAVPKSQKGKIFVDDTQDDTPPPRRNRKKPPPPPPPAKSEHRVRRAPRRPKKSK